MELFIIYGYQFSENSKFKTMMSNEEGFDYLTNGQKKIYFFGLILDKIYPTNDVSYVANVNFLANEEMKYFYSELERKLPENKRNILLKNLGKPSEILVFIA